MENAYAISNNVQVADLLSFIYELMMRKHSFIGLKSPVELFCTFDWEAFFGPYVEDVTGYATNAECSGMHNFLFACDRNGDCRLHMSHSSQSLTVVPEGPGYPIFGVKGLPPGEPKLAPLKKRVEWRYEDVRNTVSKSRTFWNDPNGGYNDSQILEARLDWETRFRELPTDDDVNALPENQKLVFKPLAKGGGARCSSMVLYKPKDLQDTYRFVQTRGVDSLGFAIDERENPDIDPTTGPGRTAAQRAEETRIAHKMDRVRLGSMVNEPAYAREYAFFLPTGQTVPQLHRVCHSRPDGFAGEADITGMTTIQYENFELPAAEGEPAPNPTFLSCFQAKVNPHRDDHKHERKFLKHEIFSRDVILLYNVQTTGTGKSLRVKLSCLQRLQDRCPSVRILPSDAPKTEADRMPPKTPRGEGHVNCKRVALTEAGVKLLPLSMSPVDVMIGGFYFLHTTMSNANDYQAGCFASVLLVKVIGQTSAPFEVDGGVGGSGVGCKEEGCGGEGGGGAGGGGDNAVSRASRCTPESMFSSLTPGEGAHVARVRADREYAVTIFNIPIGKSQIDRLQPVPKGKEKDPAFYMDDEISTAVVAILKRSFPDPNIAVFDTTVFFVLTEYYHPNVYHPTDTSILSTNKRRLDKPWGISNKIRDVGLLKKEKLVFSINMELHFFFVVVWFQPAGPPLITVVDSLGGSHPHSIQIYTKSSLR